MGENAMSIFLREIKKRLTTDLRRDERGCLIPDVRVTLGSKICIDRFYEADLLFQNLGDIKRFAQLVVDDILKSLKKSLKKKYSGIFVLGYEEYSSTLVQQVASLVKVRSKTANSEWLVLEHKAGKRPAVNFGRFIAGSLDKYIGSIKDDKGGGKILCVNVLPVGTTMSTIYKMQNAFIRGAAAGLNCSEDEIGRRVEFLNYCIVAVGNVYCKQFDASNKGEQEEKELAQQFVVPDPVVGSKGKWHEVELQPDRANEFDRASGEGVPDRKKVRYLIPVEARWSEIKIEPGRDDPLLHVDGVSTAPNCVFQSELPEKQYGYYGRKSNVDLLCPTEGESYIRYGHIERGDNHYQFYFDFEKLTEKLSKLHLHELDKWACDERKKIDCDAYNVVISPLQVTNSAFLTYVADNIFGSNLHLLHIDIDGSKKEVVRTRYGYLKNDIQRIIKNGKKVNFYYVDDSICSGSTLSRAYKLLQMLYNQAIAGLNENAAADFKLRKVFLLINRASYETAIQWVDDPNNDWCGFINLCVPSYNTHAGTCPGCKVRDRFDLLAKRSVTNDLTSYFYREKVKHNLRTVEQFDIWQDDAILNDPTYFRWFTGYIYYHDIKNHNDYEAIKTFLDSDFVKGKKRSKVTLDDYIKWRISQSKSESEKEEVKRLMKTIIAEDNFLRLKTMNEAYRRLVYEKNPVREPEDVIRKFLSDAAKEKNIYDRFMRIISYIKVISRDYLVSNYDVRKAIIKVMRDIVEVLLSQDGGSYQNDRDKEYDMDKEWKDVLYKAIRNPEKSSKKKTISSSLQFRLFNLVAHRLALLDDQMLLDSKLICEKIFPAHGRLMVIDPEEEIFCPIDPKKTLLQFVSSVKTAVMHRDNDSLCEQINEFAHKVKEKTSPGETDVGTRYRLYFVNMLLLENTRMVFDLAEELSLELTDFGKKVDAFWEYDGYDGFGGLTERKKTGNRISEDRINTVFDDGVFRQNQFHNLIDYYENNFDCSGRDGAICNNRIRSMINYFNITKFLSESEYEKKRNEKFHNLPYIYEDLCITLAELTDSDNCYLIYRKEGEDSQVIARTYCVKNDEVFFDEKNAENIRYMYGVNIGHKEFNKIINKFNEKDGGSINSDCRDTNDSKGLFEYIIGIDTVSLSDIEDTANREDDKKYTTIKYTTIKLPLNLMQDKNNDERYFYIVLESQKVIEENTSDKAVTTHQNAEAGLEDKENTKNLQRLYYVLFLRNRIWESLREDYSRLMNFRYHCSFLEPINTDKDQRSVWHISDLHIGEKNIPGDALNRLNDFIRNKKDNVPELLAVTGDIVHASKDAATAQKHYMQAGNILFRIVKELFGVPRSDEGRADLYLPYDWRRRVLITTGNHDYAAMNSVSVQTQERKVTVATPARSTGGTMSKFNYLIEFLTKFLDAPPKTLIDDDLNEIRYYKYLNKTKKDDDEGCGIFVGIFNTSSKANALQNNKVGFNRPVLKRIVKNGKWNEEKHKNEPHIALLHHSPHYVESYMNYLNDKYDPEKHGFDPKDADYNRLYDYFCEAFKETPKILVAADKSEICELNFIKEFSKLFSEAEAKEAFAGSILKQDMQTLYQALNDILGDKPIGEYGYDILTKLYTLRSTQEEDKKEYENIYKELLNNEELDCLAGHIHEDDRSNKTVNQLFDKDSIIHIAEYKIKSGEYEFLGKSDET